MIGIILMVWLYFMNQNQKKDQQDKDIQKTTADSIKEIKTDSLNKLQPKDSVIIKKEVKDTTKSQGSFSRFENGSEKIIIIETDKYYAEFSTLGGALIKFEVKGFDTWDGYPVQLLHLNKGGEINLLFTSSDGKMINTKNLFFNSDYDSWKKVVLKNNDEFKLKFELRVNDSTGAKIIKTYSFSNENYVFGLEIELKNPIEFISDYKYQLVWENSLKLTEYRSDVEGGHAEAFSYSGGELEVVDATDNEEPIKSDLTGTTEWVSSRIKYFCVALISEEPKANGSYITGNRFTLPNEGFEENYSIALKMQVKNDRYEKNKFDIYLGPVDYKILKNLDIGLEKTMRFSLDFLVRPIAQYIILPFFLFIHTFISNWGLVIIIFAIAMKIVLTPITRYQMKSMKKMSELQPKINAIKEKYKDDPQKQQEMTMKFYKEEKINPMGGCLPLLLQLPILYALFGVFNSTIELRHASFIWWIKDLSAPDVILNLPFKLPIFGIQEISGLALLMGITMFIQQKMTIKDPKQKMMIYMMPILMTLLFTNLPSGLNLYYFVFNLLSIIEQYYITHKKNTSGSEVKELSKKPELKFKGKKK